MHSSPSFGQACFYGKMEPIAILVIIDRGHSWVWRQKLLENMLSVGRAARRLMTLCVGIKANCVKLFQILILDRMYLSCLPTWTWDWHKRSLKHVAPSLKTKHLSHLDSISLRSEGQVPLGRRAQMSSSFSLSVCPSCASLAARAAPAVRSFPKVKACPEGPGTSLCPDYGFPLRSNLPSVWGHSTPWWCLIAMTKSSNTALIFCFPIHKKIKSPLSKRNQ